MAKKNKPSKNVSEEEEDHVSLQAVLLADSFTQELQPITLERPKVLLPLVNIPLIDHSLELLQSAGVKEVYVFCCAHSEQVLAYLENSEWSHIPKFTVKTIVSRVCKSVGDALRVVYERDVIYGDFVLLSGNVVSNMSLTRAIKEHLERKKDINAIMTMVIKESNDLDNHDGLFMAIDPITKRLLSYADMAYHLEGLFSMDMSLLAHSQSVFLHNNMLDCYIDICSPEVLRLFTENFDYQHLREHFVKGLLHDDIMNYKIFTHEIHSSCYVAQVDDFESYASISKNMMNRQENSTLVGHGTTVGDHSKISGSVIGEGCNIGSNVSIENSYIWNNVTIEDGCNVSHAIVCDGVVLKSRAILEPHVILSFNVVIGQQSVVPAYSKMSLVLPQPTKEDSEDEELEKASNFAALDMPSGIGSEDAVLGFGSSWLYCEEECRNLVAPFPADKKVITNAARADIDLKPDSANANIKDMDDDLEFKKEVEETFRRAVHEGVEADTVILLVNTYKLLNKKELSDCARELFYQVMKLAMESRYSTNKELYNNVVTVVTKWGGLVQHYLKSINEEIKVIMKFEEMCLDSTIEFAPLVSNILHLLYEKDIISEDAFIKWASKKESADESDRAFLKHSGEFIKWLKEAPEED